MIPLPMNYRHVILAVYIVLMGITLTAAFFDSLYWAAVGAVIVPVLVIYQAFVILFAKDCPPLADRQDRMYEND